MSIRFNYIDTNHEDIFQKGFEAANKLFECPLKEKNKIKIRRDYHRGYEKNSLSETFLYGSNQYLNNIYPQSLNDKNINILENFFYVFMEYGSLELNRLNYLKNSISELNNPRIKISKYFNKTLGQVVCGEHYDFGILTLNISSNNNELEFKKGKNWKFISEKSKLGYISFPGKQSEILSSSKKKSIIHRVKNKSNIERISFSLFLEHK